MNPGDSPLLRFVAGSGRSGTTWVQDALARANAMRPVFEPLNPYTSKIAAKYANTYLDAAQDCNDLFALFQGAATGELHTLWTHYRILRPRLVPKRANFASLQEFRSYLDYCRRSLAKYLQQPAQRSVSRTVVKCVRANLMLDWIAARFDARIVLLVRHPGAVVESQLRSAYRAWNPYPILESYRANPRLMEGPFREFKSLLEAQLEPAEALTAVWCIQNLVPLAQLGSRGYTVVFYEELLEEPAVQWNRMIDALDLESIPDARILSEPSQQASARWSTDRQFEEGYSQNYWRWYDGLETSTRSQIQSILDRSGVRFYRVDGSRPDVAAFDADYSRPLASARKAPAR